MRYCKDACVFMYTCGHLIECFKATEELTSPYRNSRALLGFDLMTATTKRHFIVRYDIFYVIFYTRYVVPLLRLLVNVFCSM